MGRRGNHGVWPEFRWGIPVAAVLVLALAGCDLSQVPILDPQGPVGIEGRDTLLRAFFMMMIVVIPVFVLTAWFVWRYRASAGGRYQPNWQSRAVDTAVWTVSGLIVLSLGIHGWIFTHRLDPYRALPSATPPLEVEVVAQDWKWLFLYPAQQVAAVNELAIPVGTPVRFRITSDTVMNSFFIPALGSQIYAMAGMQTQLNLMADAAGTFTGRNTQYSGAGFPEQSFTVRALSPAEFEAWVATARQSPQTLDETAYAALVKPTEGHPVTYYAGFTAGLFASIIARYDPAMAGHGASRHMAAE